MIFIAVIESVNLIVICYAVSHSIHRIIHEFQQWTNEDKAEAWMEARGIYPLQEPKLKSPAQAEKDMKKMKEKLPDDLIVAVSTGSTIAPENDPRPAVLQIGQTLTKAMSKLQ